MRRTSRRSFVKGVGAAALATALGPRSLLGQMASTAAEGDRVLVLIFLRGGADGLSLAAPWGDPEYYKVRPNIALPSPGKTRDGALIDLDGYFGLHPGLAPLEPAWNEGRLAILQAVGCYALTRSHFEAQEFVETGTPGVKGTSGWISRCIDRLPGTRVTEGVSFSRRMPRAFLGKQSVLVTQDLVEFDFSAPGWKSEAEKTLDSMYADADSLVAPVGRDSLEVMRRIRNTPQIGSSPAHGAVYPDAEIGDGLRQAAQIIKAELGTRCIFIDVEGDFDTHSNQIPLNAKDYSELGDALGAFDRDLGKLMDRVVVTVVTEFGRAVYETGAQGTDHGSAGAMLVLGGGVRGGKIHGTWPGIAREQLYLERDLAVTTDYRDVFLELAGGHLGIPEPSKLFPGYESNGRTRLLRSSS